MYLLHLITIIPIIIIVTIIIPLILTIGHSQLINFILNFQKFQPSKYIIRIIT